MFFTDDMIMYEENLMESTKKLLEVINLFVKVIEHRSV